MIINDLLNLMDDEGHVVDYALLEAGAAGHQQATEAIIKWREQYKFCLPDAIDELSDFYLTR